MSSSSNDVTVVPQRPTYHLPRPYTADSAQVLGGSNSGSGGNSGGGGTAPPAGGASDTAKALQFSASCQLTDTVGAIVRSDGSANAVTRVRSAEAFPAIGIIIAKSSQTQCTVQTYGLCTNVVTDLRPNTRYFVGSAGTPVTAPVAFNSGGYIQLIGFAVAANALFVQPRGDLMQLAATRNADGDDTTPAPPETSRLLYGGVLEGTDIPADDYGSRGDVYFRFAPEGLQLYGPKSDNGWGPAQSLQGADGNRIYVRQGPPDDSVSPNSGDIWLDTISSTLYPAA